MLELLVAVVILCVIAYLAVTYLPAPLGMLVAFVVVIIALVWLLESLPHHCC